jgi:hypothetical protein
MISNGAEVASDILGGKRTNDRKTVLGWWPFNALLLKPVLGRMRAKDRQQIMKSPHEQDA